MESPLGDPAGTNSTNADGNAFVIKDHSPTGNYRIIEMGWWCDNATEETNFEVGLYAADGQSQLNPEAGTLLFSSRTNAKGTGAGWKRVTGLNWTLASNSNYWLGLQIDDTATGTTINKEISGGLGFDTLAASTLPNPFNGLDPEDDDGMYGIYAVVEETSSLTSGRNDGLYVY